MKKTKIFWSILIIVLMLMIPIMPANQQDNNLEEQSVKPSGFQIEIYPPKHPIKQGEVIEIQGFHQNIAHPIIQRFPFIFILSWQYTTIELESKPSWSNVILPQDGFLSHPDGRKHNFSIFVSVTEDAPAYQYGSIEFGIITGPLWSRLLCFGPKNFHMGTSVTIQAEFVPGLKIGDIPVTTIPPKTTDDIMINITNTGNARTLLQFKVDYNEIPDDWSVQPPSSIYLKADQSCDVPFTVYPPYTDEEIDQWVTINLQINQRSVVNPAGPSQNYTVPITIHCTSL